MRKLIFILLIHLVGSQTIYARHIKGGEISYIYIGPGLSANSDKFMVTLRLFLECNASGTQLDPEVNIGFFRLSNETAILGSPFMFPLTQDVFINLSSPNPCIANPSPVCYRLRTYTRYIELPKDPSGYVAVFQRCCRINGLVNLNPSNNVGSSYTCKIHGTDAIGVSGINSSPSFAIKDTVLICQNRPFTLDFSAEDPDGDSLSYEFCDAYTAPSSGGGIINPVPPSQISFVNYATGFSGITPLGPNVTINPVTGLISGIAPSGGDFVISVCVHEWRNHVPVSEHRKDFNIRVDDRCDLAAAVLRPDYNNCDNFNLTFQNESPPSTLVHTYHWDFGVTNLNNDTSNLPSPTYTYPDTGVFNIKLIINRGEQCSDSTGSRVSVFPGFFTGFTVNGSCVQNPYNFLDTTKAKYGTVNKWRWNFGDETTAADTSGRHNPSWLYSISGSKQIMFIVASSKGCIDTVFKTIEVRDKPPVSLAFRDTLICSIDTLRLLATGPGIYSWTPNYNIVNPNNAGPFVYPKRTTVYRVNLNENGCVNDDSVKVRVVDFVTINAGRDTTICLSDTIRLKPITDGLRFNWSPPITLNDPFIKNPMAFPVGSTTYRLIASIGKCSAADDVSVHTIPYPLSFAGQDTIICFEDTATLHAIIKGTAFAWSPINSLSNPNSLTPLAFPRITTTYVLKVYDTLGCPKPGISDVLVTARPQILVNAGNDTAIVTGQPLQLYGSGAELMQWSPPNFLSKSDISNPVAILFDNFRYTLKAYTPEGCFALDTINIKVFKTSPTIFVPNAFTPGGRNPVLRPIPIGISKMEYFRVFNRWGQLVFQTSEIGKGWDGTIAGRQQNSGTYIWSVRGTDFTGKTIIRQGFAILIR